MSTKSSPRRFFTPMLIGLSCLSIALSCFVIITRPKRDNIRFIRRDYILEVAGKENSETVYELLGVEIQRLKELKEAKEALEKKKKERGYLSSKEEKRLKNLSKKFYKLGKNLQEKILRELEKLMGMTESNLEKSIKELREENGYDFIFIIGPVTVNFVQHQVFLGKVKDNFYADPKFDISDAVLTKMGYQIPEKEA